jgi:hypothetical protein
VIPAASPEVAAAPTLQPPAVSAFAPSSFFERRELKPAPVATPSVVTPTTQESSAAASKPVHQPESVVGPAIPSDPLARFKKMPVLNR